MIRKPADGVIEKRYGLLKSLRMELRKKNNVVEAKKRLYINEIDGFKKGHSLRSFAELYIKLAIEN